MIKWTKLSDRLPQVGENSRVIIFTGVESFKGHRCFDVKADALVSEEQPVECKAATHWAGLRVDYFVDRVVTPSFITPENYPIDFLISLFVGGVQIHADPSRHRGWYIVGPPIDLFDKFYLNRDGSISYGIKEIGWWPSYTEAKNFYNAWRKLQ